MVADSPSFCYSLSSFLDRCLKLIGGGPKRIRGGNRSSFACGYEVWNPRSPPNDVSESDRG